MLVKIVTLFLIAMALLAILRSVGFRLKLPSSRRARALDNLRCPTCGRIRIAENPGPCGRPGCPNL